MSFEQHMLPHDDATRRRLLEFAAANSPRTSSWYVAETQLRKEQVAEINLARQSFQTFCPRIRKTRRHARRLDQVMAPVFPGYIFVSMDPAMDQWRSINGTLGVKRLLQFDKDVPAAMPQDAMGQLFARCDNGIMARSSDIFAPGKAVRIVSGPFAEMMTSIETLDERGRVRVLLDILGSKTPVTLTFESIEPA